MEGCKTVATGLVEVLMGYSVWMEFVVNYGFQMG